MRIIPFWLTLFGVWDSCLAASFPEKVVDMTHIFDNSTLHYPRLRDFQLTILPGPSDENSWLQLEEYSSGTHVGTHFDAPRHVNKWGWTVDEVPLDRLIAPAAVVDITRKADMDSNYEVQVEDLMEWEEATGRVLNEVVLLIRSGWGRRWPNKLEYLGTTGDNIDRLRSPGLSPSAAQWLVENRRIIGIGTDAPSVDVGPSRRYQSHRILYAKNIYGIENIANMDKIPTYGATLYVMPMKIGGAGGAPCRLVASFPNVISSY